MAKSTDINARVQLVDKITQPLNKIKKNLKGLNRSFKNVGSEFQGVMEKVTAPVALLAGGGIFSIKNIISDFMSFGDSIDKASARAGVGVEALQSLRFAAEMGGMQTEQMDMALAKLGTQMGQMAAGNGDKLLALFKSLGIRYKDANGKVRNSAEVMRELADAIKTNEDPSVRLRVLTDIFGDRIARNLIPVLQDGAQGLDAMAKESERVGQVTAEQVALAAKLNDAWTSFNLTTHKLSIGLAASLAPSLQEIIEKIQNVILANQELIQLRLKEFVSQFIDVVKKIDFEKVVHQFMNLVDKASQAFKWIGGLKVLFAGWAAIIGGRFVVNVYRLVWALKGLGTAFGACFGPWGLIITGVASLFSLMYARSEKFRGAVGRLVEVIGKVLNPVLRFMGNAGAWALDTLVNEFDRFLAFIEQIADDLSELFNKPFDTLKNLTLHVYEYLTSPFRQFGEWIGGYLDELAAKFPDWLRNMFTDGPTVNANIGGPTQSLAQQVPIGLPGARGVDGTVRIEVASATGTTARVVDLNAEYGNLDVNNHTAYQLTD